VHAGVAGSRRLTDAADFGPLMLALPERKRAFVLHYLMQGCQNGTEAARQAGYSDAAGGRKVRASELLRQEAVVDALREQASKNLRHLSTVAIHKLEAILARDGNPDQLKAILAVLNRTGFDEKTTVQRVHTGVVEVNHTDAALESLAFLKSMDVPREKLIQQFGHSGLSRYEKLLSERDAKMKVIEHENHA
jgi:hypothetical protein